MSLSGCFGNSEDFLTENDRKLNRRKLGLIVNQADPLSIKIARYYQKKRNISRENVIIVQFDPRRAALSFREFQHLKTKIDAKTPPGVQAYVLSWARPYQVGCMSMTSAFALGVDEAYCAKGCLPTKANPYFNSSSSQPYSDLGIRPTIALAAVNFQQAKRLIDRGVAAEGTNPKGTAYFLNTSDKARNVRSLFYSDIRQKIGDRFAIQIPKTDALEDKTDIMFYFTGVEQVDKLDTNRFLPGAIADHLTSFGGKLTDSSQMSSLRWLEAGATGSYGTVVEPCNFPQKFPHPGVLMHYYLQGDTLIEAYWKSVAWPGQGLFIGEPLARPFKKFID